MAALRKVDELINFVSDGKTQDEDTQYSSMDNRFEVGYWKIRGLGEPARLMLAYRNVKFTDQTYEQGDAHEQFTREKWLSTKFTLDLDFPNLPYLIDHANGLRLTESRAIFRYLARCLNIGSHSDPEQAIEEMIGDIVSDTAGKFAGVCYSFAGAKIQGKDYEKEFEAACSKYLTETLPTLLEPLEKFLTSNHRKFLGGNEPCYADFQLWQFLDSNLNLSPKALDKYPKLQQCEKAFSQIPSIAKFLKEHPAGNYPMNNKVANFGYTHEHNTRAAARMKET